MKDISRGSLGWPGEEAQILESTWEAKPMNREEFERNYLGHEVRPMKPSAEFEEAGLAGFIEIPQELRPRPFSKDKGACAYCTREVMRRRENEANHVHLDWAYGRLRSAATGLCAQVRQLIADSQGVFGLHRNGDGAPWEELLDGGHYESWLDQLSYLEAMLKELRK